MGQRLSILVHVGSNNADRKRTTRIVQRYRELVGGIILSESLPVTSQGKTYKNCKRMAINALVEQMCEEEEVGFMYLWGYFVGKEDIYCICMRDDLHLSGKGATVFS